ncbi:conserved hypothetical protein [Thermotoga maritima MSB8]|uniref:Uncharacterized protein n=1 Tax=Thermotoga maritima (strain ATCC 43589 / DSM 3109 / JCM 10099 / NBRC 100826 / MSB8) TaxID=243274 RepID=Q9X225_THEMA|nr:conserved hypothetical protein [Thermotoga maritima MSB8]
MFIKYRRRLLKVTEKMEKLINLLEISLVVLLSSFSFLEILKGNLLSLAYPCLVFAVFLSLFRRRWYRNLKNEMNEKSEEMSAMNQELTALNQQLTAVNQELEASYESLQILSTQLARIMETMGEMDLEVDPVPTLERIFYDVKKLVEPLSGLELKNSQRSIVVGEFTENLLYKEAGKTSAKIFVSRELEKDEELFLNSVLNFSLFLLNAHDSYLEVMRNRDTLSRMISSLEEVLDVSRRAELIEKTLHYLKDMFPGIVLSSVSLLEDGKIKTFFLKNGQIEVVNLKRGIVVKAFETKRDLFVNDVRDFPEFYDVTNGRTRSAAAIFFEYENTPLVLEIEKDSEITEYELSSLKMMARILAIFFSRLSLYRKLRKTFFQTIEAFSYAVELKDPYTSGHSLRVADYSQEIARRKGLPDQVVERIRIAAVLHDIGKIGVKGAILNKTSKLTKEEYEEVKKHPELGEKLISKIEDFSDIAKIVRHHHEWYSGQGYPDGLRGEEIPLESRIIAVADAFDAMTSDRPYRKAMDRKTALEILRRNEGPQWDPEILKIALDYFSGL